ncbi:phage tail protein [[Pseudomonas] carboxydohydrogena]|uniref:Phage tail protein n=1 Tax=Afipia carboxydohydrogena TaxID=290 RepID=A0ABY8BRB1_AFICR|nr:hypothetical protein [[Pseudomonas] carboxydohydrogena]WEF52535.1 phage tail protein [[Pseudomonas] carboxydohydrogena]
MPGIDYRVDLSPLSKIGNALQAAGKQIPLVMTRAINHTGLKARTAMRRVLVKQTGLKARTINRAVKSTKSFNGSAFVIRSAGGNIRLKFFNARETRKGVTAAPWNERRLYPGTFIKGGVFPNRKDLGMGGQVFERTSRSRFPIKGKKSGLYIANEMVSGASHDAFYSVVNADLAPRIEHELYRVLGWLDRPSGTSRGSDLRAAAG